MYCIWILLHKHLFCPFHRPWLIMVCMIVMLNISSTFSKTLQCMLLTCQHACSHSAGYVFGPLLQQELKEFKDMWNYHRMRRNRFAAGPCDVPDDVYNLYSFMGKITTN